MMLAYGLLMLLVSAFTFKEIIAATRGGRELRGDPGDDSTA